MPPSDFTRFTPRLERGPDGILRDEDGFLQPTVGNLIAAVTRLWPPEKIEILRTALDVKKIREARDEQADRNPVQ